MARPCSVCQSPDALAIDQFLLEGRSVKDAAALHPELAYASIARHLRNKHFNTEIARKVDRAADITMSSILNTIQRSVQRTESRITTSDMPVAYVAQNERVIIEGTKTLVDVNVKAQMLQIEKSKLELSKAQDTKSVVSTIVEYIRKHHATACECCGESIERFLKETGL